MKRTDLSIGLLAASIVLALSAIVGQAQSATQAPAGRGGRGQEPGPTITVRGHTFSQLSLFQRNVGGPDDMTTRVPAAQGHRQHLLRRHQEPGGRS